MNRLPYFVNLIVSLFTLVWCLFELYRTFLVDNSAMWFFLIIVLLCCKWVRVAYDELINGDGYDDDDETGAFA